MSGPFHHRVVWQHDEYILKKIPALMEKRSIQTHTLHFFMLIFRYLKGDNIFVVLSTENHLNIALHLLSGALARTWHFVSVSEPLL